jgi:hypothetical protein
MNNNLMLLGLLAAAFLFLRRPTQPTVNLPWVPGQMENPVPGIPGTVGMYGEG